MQNHNHQQAKPSSDHCVNCAPRKQTDWLLWATACILVVTYVAVLAFPNIILPVRYVGEFGAGVVELVHKMWWGLLLGIVSVGILGGIPRELILSVLGKGGTTQGILRATLAGILLDLCSHGILLVGMKLYERGASMGQTMAFLIASPWNSLSLTLILWSLAGFKWMITFLLLSIVIAFISGLIFDRLTHKGILPANPHAQDLPENYSFWKGLVAYFKNIRFTPQTLLLVSRRGLKDSEMIMRWIFFGIILAALLRATVPMDWFEAAFGPSVLGLLATLLFATVLEVCSEGSLPVATDILLRARAPGNAFAFLMTGVSTDYTEILSIKETTRSWKIAFFLPLVTVPQVIFLAIILNGFQP